MRDPATVADVLGYAADLLETDGWSPDGSHRGGGRCIAQAVGNAKHHFGCLALDDRPLAAVRAVIGDVVTRWNAAPGRTAGEAIAAVREAERRARDND